MTFGVKQAAFVFGLILVALTLAACAAMDLGDIIRARTPGQVQQATGLPSKLSLNDAEAEYQAWVDSTRLAASQWRANIEQSNEVRQMLGQITMGALDQVGPTLAGVPVLGPSLPALTGLVGLFLGSGRLRKEKEASFNKGLEEGRTPPITPTPPTTPTPLYPPMASVVSAPVGVTT